MKKWRGPPHADIRRCGAKTRAGHPCGRYAMSNGKCRLHGGLSTGAKKPLVKHGYYTKEQIAERKELKQMLEDADALIAEMGD